MLAHNEETFRQLKSFTDRGESCCVVNPCGSGKTSVMSEFVKENRDKKIIIFTRQKNAQEYYQRMDKIFQDTDVYTYAQMLKDYRKGETGRYNADIYIADEAHYIGAEKWSEAFDFFCAKYTPLIVGFTATPQRFEHQGTDETIVTDFFGGRSAGNYTTKQLQDKGVFTEPEYVLSLYDLESDVNERMERVAVSDLSDQLKKAYTKKLEKALDDWKENSTPEKILAKFLPKYMYFERCNKILVYAASIDETDAKRKVIDTLLGKIFKGKKIKSYRYTHRDREDSLRNFLVQDDAYIKVLYSVDKIMETIHIDDLNIAIMLRPSISNRIITQQFGRLNSIGNKKRPLIIDMVDNLSNLGKINFLGGEGSPLVRGKETTAPDLLYVRKFHGVFCEIDKALSRSGFYTYQGFTGSLSHLCRIYNKTYAQAKILMEQGYAIEDIMDMTESTKPKVTQEIFDGIEKVQDFVLNDRQKEFAGKHMNIVSDYVKRHQIKDDDIIQELYMEYLYHISQMDLEAGERSGFSSIIINRLSNRHTVLERHKRIRETLITAYDKEATGICMSDPGTKYFLNEIRTEILPQVLTTLSEYEQDVLKLRYGFDGKGAKTLEETGEIKNVTKERIRQVEARALRRLRHPTRYKKFGAKWWEILADMENEPFLDCVRQLV